MCQLIWFFVTILLFVVTTLINGKLIKLETRNEIHCIDDVNKDSVLFLALPSPRLKLQTFQNLKNNLTWKNNDWNLVNGNFLDLAPILDKRWEDFPVHKNNYTRSNLKTSTSVSVYSPFGLEIFAYNYDKVVSSEHFDLVYNENKWYHFTILLKNSTVYILENDKIIAQDNFVPTSVVFRNLNKQIYFKLHQDYNIWWSNKKTFDEKASILEIPPTGKSCLTLFASLCTKCYLRIINNNEIITINSTNQQNLIKSWQMQRIQINPKKKNILTIYRKKYTDNSTGHWAIDFKLCNSNNTVTYINEGTSSNYTCNTLNIDSDRRTKRSLSYDENLCSPGKLGENCDISCENVLNYNFRYCDKYRICKENTDCYCAWGYYGQNCATPCEDGKWGLSCKKDCIGCALCDKHTGKCKEVLNVVEAGVVVVLVLVMIIILVMIKVRTNRCVTKIIDTNSSNTPENYSLL